MADSGVRIGVLRGRENSFPDAFIAKVNSTGKGVTAEFVHLGGTKLNEPVPYRVILDRMSHEVPYYAVYLKMAALQGTYCINNTFWRTADDKFFGYAAAEKVGCPALFILGRRDVMTPLRAARDLARKLARSTVVEVDGSGHALMAEKPDEVLDALRAFLPGG